MAHCHLRWISPFPRNFEEILRRYDKVLVPELNLGQLKLLIQNEFLVECEGLNKVKGKPFMVSDVADKIREFAKT